MKKDKKKTIKEILKNQIPEDKIKLVNRSFEIVGDIAICEIEESLCEFENAIGNAIMQINTSIKTVLKKSGIHKGEFRTQDLIYVAGENKKETIYLENGIRLKINPETVYFSARLSTERAELMKNLKENQRILVMFSGIGPYSITALKKQPNLANVTSIEINPQGHKYALESMKLNKNIIKKSNTYKNIIKFLKENNIPIYEKKLVEILNNLKMNFINGDVREKIKELSLKTHNKKIEHTHNELFKQTPENLFKFLKEAQFKEIILNLDNLEINQTILTLITIFSEKFNMIITIEDKNYIFENNLTKGFLLNYLEQNLNKEKESRKKIKNFTKFDEIYMPLPKDAELFLDCAFKTANQGATVHMYDFVHENDYPHLSENAVKNAAEKANKKVEILQTRKVGQYSPRKFRTCCDFKIL